MWRSVEKGIVLKTSPSVKNYLYSCKQWRHLPNLDKMYFSWFINRDLTILTHPATRWLRVRKQNVKMQIALCFIVNSVAFLINNRSLREMSQIEEKTKFFTTDNYIFSNRSNIFGITGLFTDDGKLLFWPLYLPAVNLQRNKQFWIALYKNQFLLLADHFLSRKAIFLSHLLFPDVKILILNEIPIYLGTFLLSLFVCEALFSSNVSGSLAT